MFYVKLGTLQLKPLATENKLSALQTKRRPFCMITDELTKILLTWSFA